MKESAIKFRFIAATGLLSLLITTNALSALPQTNHIVSNTTNQKTSASLYKSAIGHGQNALREFMNASSVPGMSVAIGVQGKLIWSEGFGFADLEQRAPVNAQSRFRLGSVSKMLTVAAVARLYQEGKLDLDAPIHKYVPTFPDKGKPITTRQLTGHLAGIRHYTAKDFTNGRNIDFEHYDNVLDSLKIFQDDPLVAQPGTRYQYSTFGYTLISQVVESAAHQKFLDYMDKEIFQPLGMQHTSADKPELVITGRTEFYERNREGEIRNAPFVDSSYKWAGGGFISTAEDLVRFGSAHLREGFFKSDTLKVLYTSQQTADGKETGVGIGWRIVADSASRRVFHHAGSINGGRSVIVIYPDSGLVIVLLSNLSQTPLAIEQTAVTIAEPFLEIVEKQEQKNAAFNIAGTYDYAVESNEASTGGKIEIIRSRGGYEGWMTTPGPMSEFLRRTGLPPSEKLKISGALIKGNNASLVLASAAGLFQLRLQSVDGKLTGEIKCPLGPKPVEMKIRLNNQAK